MLGLLLSLLVAEKSGFRPAEGCEPEGLKELTDDMTFDELAAWAKEATTKDVFGYYRADRGGSFAGGPYLRQHGVEPTNAEGTKATFIAPAQPGSYPFHCEKHASMHGMLTVQ